EGGHGPAVHAGRAAAAADALVDERVGRVGDVLAGAVIEVHRARMRDARVGVLDDPVVVAGEAGADPGADHGAVGQRPGGAGGGAVPGGEEEIGAAAVADVEAQRAAGAAGVDGVAAADVRTQRAGLPLDPHRGAVPGGNGEQRRQPGPAGGV